MEPPEWLSQRVNEDLQIQEKQHILPHLCTDGLQYQIDHLGGVKLCLRQFRQRPYNQGSRFHPIWFHYVSIYRACRPPNYSVNDFT